MLRKFSKTIYGKRMAGLMLSCVFLAGCFATATRVGPPPLEKHSGTAPTAAFLPIDNTNDQEVTRYLTEKLKDCLGKRNILKFVDQRKVQRVVAASGYDMGKIFGLKDSQYQDLARKLGADYTLHGSLALQKSLTFSGWRKDVDLHLYMNDADTGEKVDSWRSMTGFTWAEGEAAVNAQTMADSAANLTCAKMMKRQY